MTATFASFSAAASGVGEKTTENDTAKPSFQNTSVQGRLAEYASTPRPRTGTAEWGALRTNTERLSGCIWTMISGFVGPYAFGGGAPVHVHIRIDREVRGTVVSAGPPSATPIWA